MISRLLEEALTYASQGWKVIPLHTPQSNGACSCGKQCGNQTGKHPRTIHGCKDASSDPKILQQWWQTWPDANIGIVTGKGSGFFVLDVDPEKGGNESIQQMQKQYGNLPETRTAITGSGGKHLLFQIPANQIIRNRVNLAGFNGIDIRGENGYIVASPSLHRSGREYRWQDPKTPIKPAPTWLLDLLIHPTHRHSRTVLSKVAGSPLIYSGNHDALLKKLSPWDQYLIRSGDIPLGTRHQQSLQLATKIKSNGGSQEEASSILHQFSLNLIKNQNTNSSWETIQSDIDNIVKSVFSNELFIPTLRQTKTEKRRLAAMYFKELPKDSAFPSLNTQRILAVHLAVSTLHGNPYFLALSEIRNLIPKCRIGVHKWMMPPQPRIILHSNQWLMEKGYLRKADPEAIKGYLAVLGKGKKETGVYELGERVRQEWLDRGKEFLGVYYYS